MMQKSVKDEECLYHSTNYVIVNFKKFLRISYAYQTIGGRVISNQYIDIEEKRDKNEFLHVC